MKSDRAVALLVGVCDFGWGSLGKLRLILDKLPKLEVALFGEAPFNDTVRSLLDQRHSFVPACERAAVALVINDPRLSDLIAKTGVPVIYVDSLPYLWMTESELPVDEGIAYYCAQKYPLDRIAIAPPLRNRKNVHWIDPIVPEGGRRVGGQGVVVSLGGLHSHLVGDTADAYLKLVLLPLVRELRDSRKVVAAVCGNIPPAVCDSVREIFPDCPRIGPLSPYEFERALQAADLLVTSPGSTTILQALHLGVPTLLLPPQNLSQILNARVYSAPDAMRLDWPTEIIDPAMIDRLRDGGEDAVLRYIYQSIAEAAADVERAASVAESIGTALRSIPTQGVLDAGLKALGSRGASQVARLIEQAILAPISRTRTAS